MSDTFDVVVVGGGLVGGTLTLALARAGLDVAVVEARESPPLPCRDYYAQRVSAISPASENVLRALGVWQRLERQRICAYSRMQVWDQAGRGQIQFDAGQAGLRSLGTIVENRELEWTLDQCIGHRQIAQFRPARLEQFAQRDNFLELSLDQTIIRTRLLIGADGAHSRVRQLAGIHTLEQNYSQQAVVAVVRCREGHEDIARQRFLSTGPLAFLPLPDGYNSIVWSNSNTLAQALLKLDDPRFCKQLGEAFEYRLDEVESVGPRAAFPLHRILAQRYLAPRVALLGDAAHTIHPLAGQGVNLGILDAAALSQVLQTLHDDERDIGLMANLRSYERWRRGHNTLVAQAMSGFVTLFGSESRAICFARNLGLEACDQVLPVKRQFMRYASGLAGQIPQLAMGQD